MKETIHMLKSIWERVELFGYKPTEHVLYWIGIWCLLGIGIVYVVIYYIAQKTGNQSLLQCKMKVFFGIPCPGCGGTRALWNLCHGRILKAIYYNAFAVYCNCGVDCTVFVKTVCSKLSGIALEGSVVIWEVRSWSLCYTIKNNII